MLCPAQTIMGLAGSASIPDCGTGGESMLVALKIGLPMRRWQRAVARARPKYLEGLAGLHGGMKKEEA